MACSDCIKIINGATGLAKAGAIKLRLPVARVTDDVMKSRLATCKGCEHYIRNVLHIRECEKCGCVISAKILIPTESCPISKWLESAKPA